MKLQFALCLWLLSVLTAMAYTTTPEGVSMTVGNGKTVDITWFGNNTVRVTKTPDSTPFTRASLAVTAAPEKTKATKLTESADAVTLASPELKVMVDKQTGVVSFFDKKGNRLATENGSATFQPFNDAGTDSWQLSQSFLLEPEEAIYGLGILQNGQMSQRGQNRTLRPGNTEDGIPFFQSAKGYGIFWDNYSPTTISDDNNILTLSAETGDAVDYYFIYGKNADGVVAGVRELTGDVPMAPLWAYGFMQSRERYKSQQELLDVLERYRADGVPIDCMIQDWQYWGNNYLWNAMEFLNEGFPNPQKMLDKVHANNAKCMISIWSSFGPQTQQYKELADKGLLFDIETWPQSGISHIWPPRMDYPSGVKVYNCYSPEAREIYWKHLKRLANYGLDGWWMDSTEPDHFNHKAADFDAQTGMGSYRSLVGAFPLMTVGGVYDHQRAENDSMRVFILTRSGFFGQQRYGSNVWSGDVVSTWDMLRRQIPAGLNFSLTGNPNFNSDLGGFFAGSYNRAWQGKPGYENPAYRELYARWMQQGVFTPMMRSHGADVPRELYLYGKAGEPVYDALVGAIKLRYSLLPYIYSTAWNVSRNRDTFMRALVMDFPTDSKAADMNSQYMFGHSLLATPVIHAKYTPEVIRHDSDANAGWDSNTGRTTMTNLENVDFTAPSTHTAYLPAGTDWYYFHDGKRYTGGTEVELSLPFTEIPFFVKAGSILPIGPDVQWSSEKPWDNLELRIYPGANGSFTLYEDEGDGYAYERGVFTEIPMTWNDAKRTLTIDARKGSYPGMLENRTFRVILPDGTSRSVNYNGTRRSVKL